MFKARLGLLLLLAVAFSIALSGRDTGGLVAGATVGPVEAAAQASVVPIEVISVQPIPAKRLITIVLQSHSDKPITAWHVDITAGTGPNAPWGGFGTDAYREFAGVAPGSSHFLPRGSITVNVDMPMRSDATSTPFAVTPDCAVFADKSFVGDKQFADFVFTRRATTRDALQTIANDIREASAAAPSALQALEQVLARLDAAIAADPKGFDPVRKSFVRPNVAMAIEAAKNGRADASARMDLILGEVQANLAAAIAHSR